MYTQNTPVHVKLWHREFWHLALANLLLNMSVYMLIPSMPQWMQLHHGMEQTGLMMLAYGVGLFLLGGFCSFLVQHERRNHVCLWAIVGLMLSYAFLYYGVKLGPLPFWVLLLIRLCCGAFFGFTQMVLMSTLIIDTCESFQRTEANHSASWFGRFALSLGPLSALILMRFGTSSVAGFDTVLLGSMACCLLAACLILTIHFPFKAPEDKVRVFTFDRFFLPQSLWMFHPLCASPQHYLLRHDDVGLPVVADCAEIRLRKCRIEERSAQWALPDRLRLADAAQSPEDGRRLYCAIFHRHGYGHHWRPLPVVLHQAQPPLPARHLSEHLFPGMGIRACAWVGGRLYVL